MSIHVMTQVWKHSKQRGAGLLVLLALADWADDEGYAYPAIDKLARKARVSSRTVQRMLETLCEAKELHIEEGAGPAGVHLYKVTPPVGGDKMSPRHPRQKRATSAPKRGDNDGAPMSPNTSLTIKDSSEETSEVKVTAEEQRQVRKRLEMHFRAKTGLTPPSGTGGAGALWWAPLTEIAKRARWNSADAVAVIDECLKRAGGNFTVNDPKTIIRTARGVFAERANGNGAGYSAAADVADFNARRAAARAALRQEGEAP